jgi:hypothetical protein
MREVQRSGRRARTALLCRRVGDPRLAHHDEAGNMLVGEPEEAAGRALVSEGEEVSGEARGEDSQAVWLGRVRAKEAVEPGDVHQQPDSLISLAAR